MIIHECTMQRDNICLKVLVIEVQIATSTRFHANNRLFFMLHLLVNGVIVMAIARETVEHVFVPIQFFPYLRKQG